MKLKNFKRNFPTELINNWCYINVCAWVRKKVELGEGSKPFFIGNSFMQPLNKTTYLAPDQAPVYDPHFEFNLLNFLTIFNNFSRREFMKK